MRAWIQVGGTMILKTADLPAKAQQPLLLARRFQALASLLERDGRKSARRDELTELAADFMTVIQTAADVGIVRHDLESKWTSSNVEQLKLASSLLWKIGLAQLQEETAKGWAPAELDLSVTPEGDPILNFKTVGDELAWRLPEPP